MVLQHTALETYTIFRGHLNHASTITYRVPNNLGTITRWWQGLNHPELRQSYLEQFFDASNSGFIVYEMLYISILIS